MRQFEKTSAENDPFQLKGRPRSSLRREVIDQKIRNDLLCSACQSIFGPHHGFNQFGVSTTQYLHTEYSAFKSAAYAGCYICSLLKQKLELLVENPGTREKKIRNSSRISQV